MPEVASGIAVRYVDPAAPWLAAVGGDPRGTGLEAAAIARVRLRYDEERADLVVDEEYEAVLFPLGQSPDVTRAEAVDYDDRDLRTEPTGPTRFRLPDAPLKQKTFWSRLERDLVDHLVRSRPLELQVNRTLKLYGRPDESPEAFAARCAQAADDGADAEVAKLRDKYEAKAKRLADQIATATGRVDVLESDRDGRRNEELLGAAGSILGGLLGGRRNTKSMAGKVFGSLGSASGRRTRSRSTGARLEAAQDKVASLQDDLADLEADLAETVTEIQAAWETKANDVTTIPVSLERTDVKVGQLVLAWVPVP